MILLSNTPLNNHHFLLKKKKKNSSTNVDKDEAMFKVVFTNFFTL